MSAAPVVKKESLTSAQKKIDSSVRELKASMSPSGMMLMGIEPGRPQLLSDSSRKIDTTGLVQLYIKYVSAPQQLATDITAAGGRVDLVSEPMSLVQAWLPAEKIEEIASKPAVKRISFPDYAVSNSTVTSGKGSSVLNSDKVAALGCTGSGIKVGVISDGINGIELSQASGDIPPVYEARSARADGDLYTGAEGLALMEIVHSTAPGAKLAFSNPATSADMIKAVDILDSAFKCDVIVDDLSCFYEPYFYDGPVAQKVKETARKGKFYATAAGNYAKVFYEAPFSGIRLPVEGQDSVLHDFGGSGTGRMIIMIPARSWVNIVLQWDDLFGSSGNDYDLLLAGSSLSFVYFRSENVQDGSGDPIERIFYYNPLSYNVSAYITVRKNSGEDKRLKLFAYGKPGSPAIGYPSGSGSIFGHQAVEEAVTVGAVNRLTPSYIEDFSSRGPVRIELPLPELRGKPDICGVDGVAVTGNGGFPTTFFGTSAAAPHIAGLAALVWSAYRGLPASQVRSILLDNAVDLGDSGFDNVFGHGRADIYKALVTSDTTPPSSPSIDALDAVTAAESVTLSGTMSADTWKVTVNGSEDGVSYGAGLSWNAEQKLSAGLNSFSVAAVDVAGNASGVSLARTEMKPGGASSGPSAFSMDNIFVYPNPFDASSPAGLAFSFLNGDEQIRIFTAAGELVSYIPAAGSSWAAWNGNNASGNPVAEGIYMYLITNPAGQKRIGKIALIR